ncbi:MlaD family protein [Paracoccus homiensis]|uniref:Phospholipid/cholesterol/gamma-HCH transport system substrate-binding protein n=1 Tax=Paracoccus homiensis TaxID=364199 RepID=A0A1I0DMG3_9RHOB|nr:MlaD family protein [Paracoccus homiensis]SET33676.1 phospholipid/cholesterol/gamma-HCH transport system substrate-binding protein [Paracoccus homiensis]
METKANYLLIGAFTLAGFVGLLGLLMWFAGHEANRQYEYYQVMFPEISGISAGTQVQFSGVPTGQIVDLSLEENGQVLVRLELRQGTPVRTSSVATMVPQGITGLSILSISSGTPRAPLLREVRDEPEPRIIAGRSVLDSITQSGPELVDQLSQAATRLNDLLSDENRDHVGSILGNVDSASGQLEESISAISDAVSGISDVAEALDEFAGQFDGLAPRLETALDAATDAARQVEQTGAALSDVDYAGLSQEAQGLVGDLRAMLGSEDAGELPRNLSETLKAASALLRDMQDSGTVANLNASLQSVANAAEDLENGIGPLLSRFGRAADNIARAAQAFGDGGALQVDLRKMTREIAKAAAAVGATARDIQRNPNSLLLGR